MLHSSLLVQGVGPRDVAVSPQTVVLDVSLTLHWMVFNQPSLLTDRAVLPPSVARPHHPVDLSDTC